MRFLPTLFGQRRLGRRLIEGMMQPAMPFGGHLRGVSVAFVDDIAALAALQAWLALFKISIAEIIGADLLGPLADIEPGADGRPVPPRKDRLEHRRSGEISRESWPA